MTFQIRPASPEDADGIGRVHAASWKETYAGMIDDAFLASLSPEKSAARFRELGFKDILVLTADGSVVGFSVPVKSRDDDLPEDCADVRAIYILKDYQKLGYGKKLLNASIEKLRNEGFTDVSVWVLEGNKNAIAFYENYGFAYDGKSKEVVYNLPVVCKRYMLTHSESRRLIKKNSGTENR